MVRPGPAARTVLRADACPDPCRRVSHQERPPSALTLSQNVNYPSLRQLYNTYHEQGFELLAFSANQFGGQAPGSDAEEAAWARRKFGLDFPVFDHVMVLDKATPQWKGPTTISPVYRFLKDALPGEIPWCAPGYAVVCTNRLTPDSNRNYTKFLVGRDGVPLRRYSPGDPLLQGADEDVKRALAGKPLKPRRSSPLGAL